MKKLSYKDLLVIGKEPNGAEKIYNYFLNNWKKYSNLNATIGEALPLNGIIPIGIKDVFLIEGEITTAASKTLMNYKSPYTATVIKKLLNNNIYPMFKTNLDELCCGSTGINGLNGPIKSPLTYNNKALIPGGSSAGSAAGVLAGIIPFALGTDTGGSVRQPASCCGLYGLCPTYGAISRYGLIPLNNGIDRVGIIAKYSDDIRELFKILRGKDENDPTSCEYVSDKKPLTKSFAVFEEIPYPQEVYDYFISLGYTSKKYSLPLLLDSLAIYCILTPAELTSNLSRFMGTLMDKKSYNSQESLYFDFRENFGEEIKRRIVVGNHVLLESNQKNLFTKAKALQRDLSLELYKILENNDFILTYTAPAPMTIEDALDNKDPVNIYKCDLYTVFANLSGLPALSIPGLMEDGRPIGTQLIGRPFSEDFLIDMSEKFQLKFKNEEVFKWEKE